MIYPLTIIIISFIIDGITSLYININYTYVSIFSTIYTLIAIVMVSKYIKNDKKYYLTYILTGLAFDFSYTNTFILNMTVFFILSLIIKKLSYIFTDNFINNIIISYITIILYYILTNIILVVVGYITFNIYLLIKILYSSIIMSIIYTIIIYILNSIKDKVSGNKIR